MCDLLNSILGTIIGGLTLTLILFVLNENIFPKSNLTGEWVSKITIQETSLTKFKNLSIEYKLHLLQKGNEIIGSGEKVKDINQDSSETVFELEKRILIEVNGHYQKKYFSKDNLYIAIIEKGLKRESRSTYILTIEKETRILGIFISTAANSRGVVELSKI